MSSSSRSRQQRTLRLREGWPSDEPAGLQGLAGSGVLFRPVHQQGADYDCDDVPRVIQPAIYNVVKECQHWVHCSEEAYNMVKTRSHEDNDIRKKRMLTQRLLVLKQTGAL